MDKSVIEEMLNQLSTNTINEWYVKKEDFLAVRDVIVRREDFKHFRGIAQRSGDVLYQYLLEPRS